MEDSFKSTIDQSNSILILLPNKPFFDQVAAGLSLYLALGSNKSITVTCPTEMTVEFNRLVGVNKVSQDIGNKNLIIKFADYQANDIERVSYDIEDGQFRLTVIPKSGIVAPNKEQVDLSYSGVSSDIVIMIGGINESHFPALSSRELAGAKILHVGNREFSVSSKISILSFARPVSSVSEVVAYLLKDSGLTPDGDVATNLLMGIEEGSNKYTNPEVNADTFAIVSELMRAGGRRQAPAPDQKAYPQGAIPQSADSRITSSRLQQQAQSFFDKPKATSSTRSQSQQTALNQTEQSNVHDGGQEEIPKDWLEPRIYKGTSTS